MLMGTGKPMPERVSVPARRPRNTRTHVPPDPISRRIHDRALDCEVTRARMAKAVGWKEVSFRKRLREGTPDANWLIPLAELLQCSVRYLLTGKGELDAPVFTAEKIEP
jgi:hypothetical protein